jgi:hypothetical protein
MTRLLTTAITVMIAFSFCLHTNSHAEGLPATPDSAASWINSAPMSLSALNGKIVVLYFYEES